jgi:hypothetical protein
MDKRSLEKVKECHRKLQKIIKIAAKNPPVQFIVVWGYRGEEAQNSAYRNKKTKVKYPGSKHNKEPAEAFDFAVIIDGKIEWHDLNQYCILGGYFLGIAYANSIDIAWGGSWGWDFGHIELK